MITKIENIGKIVTWNVSDSKIEIYQKTGLEILIKDTLINKIGENLSIDNCDKVIDAKGGLLTPGFIDCHTHPIFYNNRDLDFLQFC